MDKKVALITGANSGIGLATAKHFLSKGANVVINYIDKEENISNLVNDLKEQYPASTVIAIKADVTNHEARKKLIETELNKQKITATKEEVDAEIEKIKAQVTAQGGTLEMALAQQGMTEEKPREQITVQKKLEKLLADKVAVTEAEIDTYIKDSKATTPKDMKIEDFRKQISEQLKVQKFQQEAQKWVADLTASAKIKYYVNY